MGVMQGSTSVAANAKSTNVLSGLMEEFVSVPSLVRLYATGSATGLNVNMIAGGAVMIEDQAIGLQNRFPLIPDDFLYEFGATGPSDRLVLSFRNTTGGALTAFWRVDIIPV
jgi:hypothetical protein